MAEWYRSSGFEVVATNSRLCVTSSRRWRVDAVLSGHGPPHGPSRAVAGLAAYQSDWATEPACSVCGLQLLIISTISPKSLQDACDFAQCSPIPAGDS